MGWGSKKRVDAKGHEVFENVLGPSSVVSGDLTAEGGFRIDGALQGRLESHGVVVVGESGMIRGDVVGREVVIAGKVFGNVTATTQLDILETGRLEGDIEAKSLHIETGGVFRGTSHMRGADDARDSGDKAEAGVPLLTSVS
jgi:cytoskeletal protein CcmA (bactofilin family)